MLQCFNKYEGFVLVFIIWQKVTQNIAALQHLGIKALIIYARSKKYRFYG